MPHVPPCAIAVRVHCPSAIDTSAAAITYIAFRLKRERWGSGNGRIYTIAADTKVNTAVPENDRQRYQTVPGTAKLLVLEPIH